MAGFWESFLRETNPEIYQSVQDMRDRNEAETLRNLYAQGFEGDFEDLENIQEPAGFFDRTFGDGVGDSRRASPWERYVFGQGKRGKQLSELEFEGSQESLTGAKSSRKRSELKDLISVGSETGTIPTSIFGDLPEDVRSTAGQSVIRGSEDRSLRNRYLKAQIEAMLYGGKGGKKTDSPYKVSAAIAKQMKPTLEKIVELKQQAAGETDRGRKLMLLAEAKRLENIVGGMAQAYGGDSILAIGGMPSDPVKEVYGVDATTASEARQNPEVLRRLELMEQSKDAQGSFWELLKSFSPGSMSSGPMSIGGE